MRPSPERARTAEQAGGPLAAGQPDLGVDDGFNSQSRVSMYNTWVYTIPDFQPDELMSHTYVRCTLSRQSVRIRHPHSSNSALSLPTLPPEGREDEDASSRKEDAGRAGSTIPTYSNAEIPMDGTGREGR